jgi:uncharacterized RDD family membrane protein YckC
MKTDLLSKRYGAWLLDGLIFFIPLVVAIVLWARGHHSTAALIWTVTWLAATVGNHVLLEGLTGQTLGKRLTGLHTRRAEAPEQKPGIPRAALRYLLLPVDDIGPGVPLVAGISIRYSDRQQRVGDRVAGTLVGIPIPPRAVVGERAGSSGILLDLPAPDGRSSAQARATANWRAGWYPDPGSADDRLRWFDGEELTGSTRSRTLTEADVAALIR